MSGIPRHIRSSKRTRLSLYPCCIFPVGMHTNAVVLRIFVRLASWLAVDAMVAIYTPRCSRQVYTMLRWDTGPVCIRLRARGVTDETVHSVPLRSSRDRSKSDTSRI